MMTLFDAEIFFSFAFTLILASCELIKSYQTF